MLASFDIKHTIFRIKAIVGVSFFLRTAKSLSAGMIFVDSFFLMCVMLALLFIHTFVLTLRHAAM